jgi:hypothetical protein
MLDGRPHAPPSTAAAHFPLWLRLAATAFAAAFVAVHASYGNAINFLWLSDVAMFGAVAALWLRSRLVASMMLLASALTDGVAWSLDFILGLAVGWHPFNATTYMFDPHVPLVVRGLSLFHLILPWMLLWMVRRLGYDRRALAAQTALTLMLFCASRALADPVRNINWVYGPGKPQTLVPEWVYLAALMTVFPLLCYLPAHLILIGMGWERPDPRPSGEPDAA